MKKPRKGEKMKKNETKVLMKSIKIQMSRLDPADQEYKVLLNRLSKLAEINVKERDGVDKNTALMVGGNILGVLAILFFEQAHVVTTKAVGFVLKPKVR